MATSFQYNNLLLLNIVVNTKNYYQKLLHFSIDEKGFSHLQEGNQKEQLIFVKDFIVYTQKKLDKYIKEAHIQTDWSVFGNLMRLYINCKIR